MNVNKSVLADLKLCYAITLFEGEDGKSFIVATEKEGPCLRFDLEGNLIETLWEGPGGVMTLVQVPGRKDQILSTHEFYSPNCGADQARLVSATRRSKGDWQIRKLCDLPYVHRFGILYGSDNTSYLIACTIKSACEYKEDWRTPGKIYGALLPQDLTQFNKDHPLELKILRDNQLKNHGFFVAKDQKSCYISTDAGVFHVTPPVHPGAEWTFECILEKAVSDICLVDFDQDGREELLTLSPFHGEELCVFHQDEAGSYQLQYQHADPLPFLHAIWSCEIAGKPCALVGHRKGERDLYRITWNASQQTYQFDRIDHDRGPANVCHFQYNGMDHVIAANRETNEVALYQITD